MSHTYLMSASTSPALVSGQVSTIEVAREAVTVVFHNISVNTDILLSLGVVNPGPTTTPGGEWPYVLPAGGSLTVQVPGTSRTQTAVAQYWQGKIWVLPINQVSQQSATGQQPSIGNLWIMTFAAGEEPANVSPSSQAVSQIGQQRVVSVLPGVNRFTGVQTGVTAPSDIDLTNGGVGLLPVNVAKNGVQVFTYALSVWLPPIAGNAIGVDFTVFVDVLNTTPATIAAQKIAEGVAYSGTAAAGTLAPFVLPPSPLPATDALSWAHDPTAATFRWRLHVNSVTAGAFNLKWYLLGFADIVNVGLASSAMGSLGVTAALF